MIPEWSRRCHYNGWFSKRYFRFACWTIHAESALPTRERANVVWKSSMIKKSNQYVAFLMLAWAKIQNQSLYEANTKKMISKRLHAETKNDAWDTRDFTIWRRMMLGSKSCFRALIKKLCSILSLAILFDVYSYCLYTLFSVQDHWIKTFSFSCSDGRIQG